MVIKLSKGKNMKTENNAEPNDEPNDDVYFTKFMGMWRMHRADAGFWYAMVICAVIIGIKIIAHH